MAPKYHDSPLAALCPNLTPAKEGITFDYFINQADNPRRLLNADSTLHCFSQLYQIYINDSLRTDVSYRFHKHPERNLEGLLTILDIQYLARGEHLLRINSKKRHRFSKKKLSFTEQDYIPFWKE